MTATAGQDATISIGATPVAGVRVSGFTRNATPIDISDKGSAGYQELMAGKVSSAVLTFNAEGVEKDQVLRDLALGPVSGWTIENLTLDLANGDKISGTFFMGEYTEGDDYKEATTFSATFQSSGQWTLTQAGG
ncbi:phage tail tube protein [Rhodovulum marinum]|uniref:Putative secreted protein n=1 Tax=Rhodovulum marinum TaxID=320662 RepID=A0A4R2Q535_9RHOB|nr:phage tail tube protein [Rhodovulum marinum]TCP43933.1 putative secreted protein [Rhodovulum marinum]